MIHWGGACGKDAPCPRIALAATFRAKGARPSHLVADGQLDDLLAPLHRPHSGPSTGSGDPGSGGVGGAAGDAGSLPLESGSLPLESRARLIAKALLMYADWYDLDGGALPEAFFRMAAHTPGETIAV